MGKIRVAIIGVGNCASALVQGVHFYRNADPKTRIPGLMNVVLGGYHVGDIEFSAAFDITTEKVGIDLAEAIFAKPNNTFVFSNLVEQGFPTGVEVMRGSKLDGVGKYLYDILHIAPGNHVDVASVLRDTGTDVVINYLPVGSQKATEWYAQQAIDAGCAFINCIPVFIASNKKWAMKFEEAHIPVIGDDIKSQVGSTIVHRVLTSLFEDRGVQLDRTYQLNVGGNTDFLNMLERERLESKKISKTRAVSSMLSEEHPAKNIHIGPSDHVPWLEDRKFAFIRLEGTTFGNVPLLVDVKLEVWDSPNSAGVVIDAIRCAKLGLDSGTGGALVEPSAYFMKSPVKQFKDSEALRKLHDYIGLHTSASKSH